MKPLLVKTKIASHTLIDALARAHLVLLQAGETDEERGDIAFFIGRALGRGLAESFGADTGLALASILFDGVLDRWAPPPLEDEQPEAGNSNEDTRTSTSGPAVGDGDPGPVVNRAVMQIQPHGPVT
jgi:hypothetical protein